MIFIDPHLHTDMIDDNILERLSMAGMEACIIPSPHMFKGMADADALFRLWDRFLEFEVKSAKSMGFEAYVSISIPFYGLNSRSIDEALKKMPDFLKHERVVAIGEIGLDTGIEDEDRLLRAQLQIARESNLPVIAHTPIRLAPQAPEVIKQIVQVIKEEKFDISRVVLDHTGESTFEYRLGTGAMVGLSVCHDKLPPEVAAQYVIDNPGKRDKLLLNCELAGGDMYFTVPRVLLALKMMGMRRDEIEKVAFWNPKNFFKLPVE